MDVAREGYIRSFITTPQETVPCYYHFYIYIYIIYLVQAIINDQNFKRLPTKYFRICACIFCINRYSTV